MKDMIKRIREEREGFTLAELLIVVAIIAVLVAIAIPVFNSQLEKSREATDAANIRAAYAEVMTSALTGDTSSTGVVENNGNYSKNVDITQQDAQWHQDINWPDGLTGADSNVTVGGIATVTYTKGTGDNAGTVTVTYGPKTTSQP